MPSPETNRRKIVARLEKEGWTSIGGGDHENFVKDGHRMIQVPRHRELSPGGRRAGTEDQIMTRYIALIDGKAGAYGISFPDCPGCTAMGSTIDEVLQRATGALAEWAEHAVASKLGMPVPRPVGVLMQDSYVALELAEGAVLAFVPLIIESGKPVRANLSIDAGLLSAIDDAAKSAGLTRSAFLASAARDKILTSV